jgi:hypothetical protein
MNIQTKSTALLATRFTHPYCGMGCLLLSGLLIAGFVHPAMAVESATPVTTTEADCRQTLMAVDEGMKSRMPADPEVAQAVLNLRREGNELCHQGSKQSGQSKLQQAAALLESGALPTAKTKP